MSEVAIRPAREADFDDLIALYGEFHAFHVRGVPNRLSLPELSGDSGKGGWGQAWMREQLRAITRDPAAGLLLAEAGGRVVGLAEVYL
jgi:hypothetical protein